MTKVQRGLDARSLEAGNLLPDSLFDGPGEMRALCRSFDWSTTALGPVADWPRTLRGTAATLLASRHPMFMWWGPELIQIYNDAYRPSFGASGRHPGALGMRGEACWPEIWNVIGPQIVQVMQGGEATWHEDQLVPIERNGQLEDVYWTYSYSPVFDDAGAVGGVLVVCQETTRRVEATQEREALIDAERRAKADAEEAREALGRVLEQAPVGVAVLDGREMLYTVANPRYRQIIGNRDPVGRTLLEMFPDLVGSQIESVLQFVYDSAVPFAANDLLIRFDSAGDGTIDNYYDLVYHPLTGASGVVSGIVVIVTDVTERRRTILDRERLLEDAERARADAENANRGKSDFLAVMSHELRTPLNAIGGYADLLMLGVHGPVTSGQEVAIGRIQKSCRHLLGLINTVLNFARVESGHLDFQMSDIPLDEILATCHALIAPQAHARRITLGIERCDGTMAYADPEKVRQVVLNLVTNAVKFTEHGGTVTVSCDVAGGHTLVHVKDSGKGIARDQLARIFEPFVQVDSQLTRTGEGIGLGLAISRELARGMGGDVTVVSEVGIGSTFTITLPASQRTMSTSSGPSGNDP
ncbi:MAG: PAS domain-containing protein [Polaromonas sp.]|nr:PAS domain-containing protein [Gemmatimonadaceae bacterium]